jgi:hypothetical protein
VGKHHSRAMAARSMRSPRNATRWLYESVNAGARSQPSKRSYERGIQICKGCVSRYWTGMRNCGCSKESKYQGRAVDCGFLALCVAARGECALADQLERRTDVNLKFLLLFFALAGCAHAQPFPRFSSGIGNPSGNCGNSLSFYVDDSSGSWWTCSNGTWVQPAYTSTPNFSSVTLQGATSGSCPITVAATGGTATICGAMTVSTTGAIGIASGSVGPISNYSAEGIRQGLSESTA